MKAMVEIQIAENTKLYIISNEHTSRGNSECILYACIYDLKDEITKYTEENDKKTTPDSDKSIDALKKSIADLCTQVKI